MIDFNLNPFLWLAAIGATLGIWKAVEIVIWVCQHIKWQ
jgi:hypothetical protein